ncbi:MAG: type III-B CRISPR module RAMP protein Cmr4, partial [Dactylosporangium sp.]|nr:type III-B CRISPR module RAMP protein Cmr4 [Dactylosporangium sp.]
MESLVLGLLAETSIHPGAGRGLGVIDLPVSREATTGYPVIVGSSLKGSLRDALEQRLGREHPTVATVFGNEHAGDVLVSDARLLLLPVRSLAQASRWVTCPQVIERYARDLRRAGRTRLPEIPTVTKGALAYGDQHLVLEERLFDVVGEPDRSLVELVSPLIAAEEVRQRLSQRLVVLSDDDFAWFCQFGLPVQARNKLDGDKRSQNLWYEETLPPDTVM